MVYAEKKYGKLSLEQVMAPAIKLAEDGFALAAQDAKDLRDDKHLAEVSGVAAHLSARWELLQSG